MKLKILHLACICTCQYFYYLIILSPDFKRNTVYRKWREGSLSPWKKMLQTVPAFHSYLWNLEIYPKHIYIYIFYYDMLFTIQYIIFVCLRKIKDNGGT